MDFNVCFQENANIRNYSDLECNVNIYICNKFININLTNLLTGHPILFKVNLDFRFYLNIKFMLSYTHERCLHMRYIEDCLL